MPDEGDVLDIADLDARHLDDGPVLEPGGRVEIDRDPVARLLEQDGHVADDEDEHGHDEQGRPDEEADAKFAFHACVLSRVTSSGSGPRPGRG